MDNFFYDGFGSLIRVTVSASILYAAVIIFVRVSGKRSTSKMNNFDWVVTVAMGSLVGSGIVLKDVTVSEVLVAIASLIALQYCVTFVLIRNKTVTDIVKASPRLLLHRGVMLPDALREERISESELLATIRENGLRNVEDVEAIVLEADATLSVLPKSTDSTKQCSAFSNVEGWPTSS